MDPADFASMCVDAHERDVPLVFVLDGLPVRMIMCIGPHLRVPPSAMSDKLRAANGHGSSVLPDAPEGFVFVAAHAQFPIGNELRRIEGENGQYVRIDTSRISFATFGEIGKPVKG